MYDVIINYMDKFFSIFANIVTCIGLPLLLIQLRSIFKPKKINITITKNKKITIKSNILDKLIIEALKDISALERIIISVEPSFNIENQKNRFINKLSYLFKRRFFIKQNSQIYKNNPLFLKSEIDRQERFEKLIKNGLLIILDKINIDSIANALRNNLNLKDFILNYFNYIEECKTIRSNDNKTTSFDIWCETNQNIIAKIDLDKSYINNFSSTIPCRYNNSGINLDYQNTYKVYFYFIYLISINDKIRSMYENDKNKYLIFSPTFWLIGLS